MSLFCTSPKGEVDLTKRTGDNVLLILIAVHCLAGQPTNCNVTSMKGFEMSDAGVRVACHELFLTPFTVTDKKALVMMYANGLDLKMGDAGSACMATPEKLNPTEFKKAFLENLKK